MSKQTMDSLEHSEKRAEAAEKVSISNDGVHRQLADPQQEVLVLRDREAALRRQLMEHWSGVMAWEVRRLERVSAETQARSDRQIRQISTIKNREHDLTRQVKSLVAELESRAGRVTELEEMVVEMGRRERAIEEDVRDLDTAKSGLEKERDRWMIERAETERAKEGWDEERAAHEEERQGWQMEKRMMTEEKEALMRERQTLKDSGRMSERDRAMMSRMRGGLSGMLGRKGGVGEAEMVDALEEVRGLLELRENEVMRLKEEMREVNMGLEEEVRRVSADRDGWKCEVESGAQGRKEESAALLRQIRVSRQAVVPL